LIRNDAMWLIVSAIAPTATADRSAERVGTTRVSRAIEPRPGSGTKTPEPTAFATPPMNSGSVNTNTPWTSQKIP
jgi:hypothetical protein